MTDVRRLEPLYRPPSPETLESLYLDTSILVVNKPSGLLSVPGRGPEKATCAHSIASERHGPVFTVHRLDMDTSGLMVFARTREAQRQLSILFQDRRTEKTYIAVTEGLIEQDSGRIDQRIAKFSLQRPLRHLASDGQEAITDWSVITRDPRTMTSRVRLHPKTGRSHQLRLHMQWLGHPILGDPFYGDSSLAGRLCLHASELKLFHPKSSKPLSFYSEPPF